MRYLILFAGAVMLIVYVISWLWSIAWIILAVACAALGLICSIGTWQITHSQTPLDAAAKDELAGVKFVMILSFGCVGIFCILQRDYITKLHVAEQHELALSASESRQGLEKTRIQDDADAKEMGVSYMDYIQGKNEHITAHVACQNAVKDTARWSGASMNWLPNYSWSINHRVISIRGNDVELKNGFGGVRSVDYSCRYDIPSRTASIISAG